MKNIINTLEYAISETENAEIIESIEAIKNQLVNDSSYNDSILSELSGIICTCDNLNLYGVGDLLYEAINELKELWKIEE